MIVLALVMIGVTPVLTEMLGVTVPEYRSFPAPLDAVPMAKCVIVAVPPVAVGNVMLAVGETLLPVTVQPPLLRLTLTRA